VAEKFKDQNWLTVCGEDTEFSVAIKIKVGFADITL
jgi:hypothetical protein